MIANFLVQCNEHRFEASNLGENMCNACVEGRLNVVVKVFAAPPLKLVPFCKRARDLASEV